MKKLPSLIALLGFAASAFATGPLPINSPLTGTMNFTNAGATSVTNVFEPGFTYAPSFNAYLVSANTNALPLTTAVTTSNCIVTINTTTNATVYWVANPAAYVIQSGSIVVVTALSTNITFQLPYALTPNVVLTGSVASTNCGQYVTGITVTNFNLTATASNTVNWIAFGPAYSRVQSGPSGTDGVVTH